ALTSGHLAGRACVEHDLPGYEAAYRGRLRPRIHAAAVNRFVYRWAGVRGYRTLVERVCGASDPRAWLRRHYDHRWWTPLVYPIARAHAARLQARAAHECREGCDCTYCRCVREAATQHAERDVPRAADHPAEPLTTNVDAASRGEATPCP